MYVKLSIPLTLQLQFHKKNIGYQMQCPVCSTLICINLIIPNIIPGGLFSGSSYIVIHGRSFPFQKLVPKGPRALYTRWGLLSEFYGI